MKVFAKIGIFVTVVLLVMIFTSDYVADKTERTDKNEELILENKEVLEGEIEKPLPRTVFFDVPFTPQAPFAEWSKAVYQSACEEASMVIVGYWLSGELFTPEKAVQEILELTQYEKDVFGNYYDTSAADTLEIFKSYYNHQEAELFYDIGIEDIKRELAQGGLVIVPANGQKLGNPNFTPPGPLRHMLVIIGYDDNTKEFITNDPGTRWGKSYRYPYQVLLNAIRDYPSGYNKPILGIRKAMIVVK